MIRGDERQLKGDELVKKSPKGPDIRLVVIWLIFADLSGNSEGHST